MTAYDSFPRGPLPDKLRQLYESLGLPTADLYWEGSPECGWLVLQVKDCTCYGPTEPWQSHQAGCGYELQSDPHGMSVDECYEYDRAWFESPEGQEAIKRIREGEKQT